MKHAAGRTFHVRHEQVGATLAAALRGWIGEEASWSEVRRLIKTRHVLVNGNLCLDIGRRLKGTDVVKLLAHPAAPLPREDDVKIRYLDTHIVVVEKPAGMTSVRHAEERNWSEKRKQDQPTLEDLLPRIIAKKEQGGRGAKQQRGRGKSPWKPNRVSRTPPVRPVHRLDRDTSGLMVFARTVPAERSLGQQFRHHVTERSYLAIAEGDVAQQTIESNLVRDRGDGRRGSTTLPNVGKRAVTHVKPLERLGDYTLVECRLETGRTHQIRIHLSEAAHPLCGEKVYRQPLFGEPIPDRSGAPRLALHSAELAFEHPITGEAMSFKMPLPEDFAQFLARLRHESRQ
jgi:23S rRNA pseudouridine1911/1915/1917 synthase